MSQIADAESEAGSMCDEERVRKLFQACDGDGDGFIDSQDLLTVCKELNLENSVEELMRELGADEHGRISYQEFLRRRLALRPEIEALRSGKRRRSPHHTHTPEYLPTSSDNSLGTVSGRHESWEFDSGARDLSPEPHSLQKLVEAAAGGTGNMLDLANKLHAAALSSLRSEVAELNSRLSVATRAKEAAEAALESAESQAARAEQRAEQQAARHEERATELHSVIAELRRNLERHRATVITEEDESEVEESRDAEGSITNPVEESDAGGDLQEVDADRTLGDADSSCCEDVENRRNENGRDQLESPAALPPPEPTQQAASCQSVAVATLQEEVTALRAEIAVLHSQLAQYRNPRQYSNHVVSTNSDSPRREQRMGRDKLFIPSLESVPSILPPLSPMTDLPSLPVSLRQAGVVGSPISMLPSLPVPSPEIFGAHGTPPVLPPMQRPPPITNSRDEMPILRMAERVRLRRTDERHITGPDIANLGVCSTMVAEHLVSDMREQSDLAELNGSEMEWGIETERLHSRLEHAKANNAVLALTLQDSKAQCDRLSLLVGKYESNATALRLALSFSDRAIEAYDVLVALLETEIALGTNCNDSTTDNRRTAEQVALHVLDRLENDCTGLGAPWEDSMVLSNDTEVCWRPEDETRLRNHISKLKGERSMVRSTAVELESVHSDAPNSKSSISWDDTKKLDLETAVLMQELMAMREDKAELRARVHFLERTRTNLERKVESQDEQILGHLSTIQYLQGQLRDSEAMNRLKNQERESSDMDTESNGSELAEALSREDRLRERLQELTSTVNQVTRNSELRHQKNLELINDLKLANGALVQTLEKSKKKYQSRLKKLEQQMLGMVDRHASQVKSLKQRIILLEEETSGYKSSLPLQSQSSGASETSL